ncbi:hypothetical protein HDU83_006854 [Entophlyctis luteolus]|nr:hypothetical protein HDU83_006854 [Entophlyctis luteolus]KAJ3389126.1 hypothetical protein HDU84_009130 [Entophlyctis sp. JEL0112]
MEDEPHFAAAHAAGESNPESPGPSLDVQQSSRRRSSRRLAAGAPSSAGSNGLSYSPAEGSAKHNRDKRGKGNTQALGDEEQVLLRVKANRLKRSAYRDPIFACADSEYISEIQHSQIPPNQKVAPHLTKFHMCLPKNASAAASHIDDCLSRLDSQTYSPETAEDDQDQNGDQFEEYTWAGQTRVRATSMLEGGGLGAIVGISSHNRNTAVDIDEDVLIDDEAEDTFGPVQYSQEDVQKYVVDGIGENSSPAPFNEEDSIDVESVDITKGC